MKLNFSIYLKSSTLLFIIFIKIILFNFEANNGDQTKTEKKNKAEQRGKISH